ncbi:MAG: hypothetical protein COS49_02200, partial [Candidatus Portnoybacteria bacterium CG03_land_8_20_14_0_80_41_10]
GIGDATPTNKLDVTGAIGISDTTVIDASRNLTNIGTITSGLINSQTISSAANFTGTVNAVTGYKVNGAAASGNVLRGDGTNFVSATLAGSDVTGAALTKTDDTNVTLTLGGTPTTALLRASSITVGWSGQLAAGRGGTGSAFFAVSGPATTVKTFTFPDSNATILYSGGPLGTPSSGTLTNATDLPIVAGTTGTLTVARGGTGATTLTGLLQGNGTSAITAVTGTAGQIPYFNGTNTLLAT